MGRAKDAMMEREDARNAAKAFLVEVGTLEECGRHGYIMGGDEDLERLWPIAMAERNKGARGRVPWAASLKAQDFTDLLKETYDDSCGDCIGCVQNERE